MKTRNTVLRILCLFLFTYSFGQIKMLNPTDINYAEAGRTVAQYKNYSVMGTHQDGYNTSTSGSSISDYRGRVYLYQNGQLQRNYIMEGDLFKFSRFGERVAISENWVATTALAMYRGSCGGPCPIPEGKKSGAVFLAKKINGQYSATMNYEVAGDQELKSEDGGAIALYGDQLVIGDPMDNKVLVYKYDATQDNWILEDTITYHSDIKFGTDVAIDQDKIVVGGPFGNNGLGLVIIYKKNQATGKWETYPTAGSYDWNSLYGSNVDIQGNRVIASGFDHVKIIEEKNGKWETVFEYDSDNENPDFPVINSSISDVAIDQDKAVIGTFSDNIYHTLLKNSSYYNPPSSEYEWSFYGKSTVPIDENYGRAVDISDFQVLAGALNNDNNIARTVGAMYSIHFVNTANNQVSGKKITNDDVLETAVFPNPTSSGERISIVSEGNEILVYDISGKLVHPMMTIENDITKMDTGNLSPGIYILNIKEGNNYSNHKLIIQ